MRVLYVGDSHMEQLGPRLGSHIAERGWGVRTYAARGVGAHGKHDRIVVELGGNDGTRPLPSYERHRRDIEVVLEDLGEHLTPRGRVIWFGPAVARSRRVDHDHIAELQRRIVPALGVQWHDSRRLTRVSDLRADGLHFTPEGYARWARGIERALAPSSWWAAPVGLAVGFGTVYFLK